MNISLLKSIYIKILFLCSLLVIVFSYFYFTATTTSANPDYICIKNVNRPCKINSCGDWKTNHTRTCRWTKVTQVGYYLIRTNCESWYTKLAHWGSSGASGRQWSDYVRASTSCSITQSDYVSPAGSSDNE